MINIPRSAKITEKYTVENIAALFVAKLVQELVEIPGRRRELMEGRVQRIRPLKSNVRIKDQWIIPENVPAWYDLIYKVETDDTKKETAKHIEEMSSAVTQPVEKFTAHPLIERYFGPTVAQKLKLKTLSSSTAPGIASRGPVDDMLIYYNIDGMIDDSLWTDEILTGSTIPIRLLGNLSKLLDRHPIVLITEGEEDVQYGFYMNSESAKNRVYIIVERKDGRIQSVEPITGIAKYVDLNMLQGVPRIYDVIKMAKLRRLSLPRASLKTNL